MKKSLIALAALAVAGVASAQVTVYGKLDVGASVNTKTGMPDQGLQFGSGNYEGSRIGVKGSADLGVGMKGMFQLEGGVGSTDGTFSGFTRVAKVGVETGMGTVTIGKQWTPYDSAYNDAMEYNGFSAMGSAFYSGFAGDNGNDGSGAAKNSIQWSSPSVSGFNAVVLYAPNADATATTTATNYFSVGLNYGNGPLAVNFATEKVNSGVHGAGTGTTNSWILATSYNMGVASVSLAFEGATADIDSSKGTQGKDSGTAIGVSFPINKTSKIDLGWASESSTTAGKTDGKATSWGVQYIANLNAATAFYAGYRKTDTTLVNDTATTTATKLATGIRYNF